MTSRKHTLQYVQNTQGGATVDNFVEDWAPIGAMEWNLLTTENLAMADREGRIFLTSNGANKLEELSKLPTHAPDGTEIVYCDTIDKVTGKRRKFEENM